MTVPVNKDIINLGYVDERTKFDAISGCEFLVNPSPYESLSIVLLEAWSLNKPALVTAKSKVMVSQCRKSGAGFWYDNYDEFEENALRLVSGEETINGEPRKFVEDNYSWEVVTQKYATFFDERILS